MTDGGVIMVESAMKKKLNVRPLVGFLQHSAFWEGPCRAGKYESLQPEAEKEWAKNYMEDIKEKLKDILPEANVMEPIPVPYIENLTVPAETWNKIEENLDEVDTFVVFCYRVPKLEKYRKTTIYFSNGNEGADLCAYYRSIGVEAYNAIDMEDLNEILHGLWVKKCIANTKALILTSGQVPTYGIQSNIRDLEYLRKQYGFEVLKLPFKDIFNFMDKVDETKAKEMADELLSKSQDTKVNPEFFVNDIKYYLAAKDMMAFYGCNAFSTACIELCASRIPQERKFTPCVCHSLLKAEGIPSSCEEDLNAMMAMMVLMYGSGKSAFMGNPFLQSPEVLSIHHAVPALKMNGFDKPDLNFSMWAFTGQGFGGKMQIDFAQNEEDCVTFGRFNPMGTKMVVKVGEVLRSEFRQYYCSPHYFIKLENGRDYMHTLADFGHHQVLVFGNQLEMVKRVARYMGFEVVEG
jgi:hypothetical protein